MARTWARSEDGDHEGVDQVLMGPHRLHGDRPGPEFRHLLHPIQDDARSRPQEAIVVRELVFPITDQRLEAELRA